MLKKYSLKQTKKCAKYEILFSLQNTHFLLKKIHLKCSLSYYVFLGKKTDSMRFSSEHRADIITETMKFKHEFGERQKVN